MVKGTVCTGLALLFLLTRNANATFDVWVHPVSNFAINGTEYGPPYPSLYGKLKHFRLDNPNGPLNDVSKLSRNRSISIMKAEEVLHSKPHWDLFAATVKSPKHALLLVIPKRKSVFYGSQSCDDAHATPFAQVHLPVCQDSRVHQKSLVKLEEFLKTARCSVGVLEDGKEVETLCKLAGGKGGLLEDEVRIATNQFEPSALTKFSGFNLFGSLKNQNLGDDAPTLLITAPLDTFSFVQTLTATASYNTPLAAFLELVRVFGEGFLKEPVPWKVKFLLTTGTLLDFYGLKHFLKKEKVEFVIALDDLDGESLYLHKGLVDEKTSKFVKVLGNVLGAETMERDSSGTEFYFPHDVFTKHKVSAVTISCVAKGTPLPLRLSSFNFKFDAFLLSERVLKLAEAVAKFWGVATKKVEVTPNDVLAWEALLGEPRNVLAGDISEIWGVEHLSKALDDHLDVKRQNFKASISTSVIKCPPVSKTTVHLSKHAVFDVFIAIVIFSYVFVVWSVVRTPKKALKDIMGLLAVFGNSKGKVE